MPNYMYFATRPIPGSFPGSGTVRHDFIIQFLSHLLIAGCDIGVQISVRPCVRSSVRQHLRRSLVFLTSEIAASLKPCIVIVPDISFKQAP